MKINKLLPKCLQGEAESETEVKSVDTLKSELQAKQMEILQEGAKALQAFFDANPHLVIVPFIETTPDQSMAKANWHLALK